MISMTLRALLIGLSTATLLAGCGGQSADTSAATNSASPSTSATSSSLGAFAGQEICGILSTDILADLFSPQAAVETNSRVGKGSASCTWSWARPDAEERRQAMVQAMMKSVQSGSRESRPSMSAFALNYEIRVALQDTKATSKNFVPRKLSESELQAQIAEADKRTQERLTDKQKQLVEKSGIGAMTDRLLRKANQREVVDGAGEAAYWTPVGNGSLHVLTGNKAVIISPAIADDKEGNLDIAKKIYAAITQ